MKSVVASLRGSGESGAWVDDLIEHLDRFYELYFREVRAVFPDVWESAAHSVRSGTALRAFLAASVPVARAVYSTGGSPAPTVRAMLAPWATRIGGARFETKGAWRARAAGGGRETGRLLSRELVAALGVVGEGDNA
jgi:hypothetical protein